MLKFVFAVVLGCLLFASLSAEAKVVEGKAKLSSSDTEAYITKFSFSPDTKGSIVGTFEAQKRSYWDSRPHDLSMCIISESKYDKYREFLTMGSLCKNRVKLCNVVSSINHSEEDASTIIINVDVSVREASHYWYVLLTDCYLEEYDAHPPKMNYHLALYNGESHLPADEDGMLTTHWFMLMGLLVFGAYFIFLLTKQYRSSGGSLHLSVIFLGTAYLFQLGSIAFEYMHLQAFDQDGMGLRWRHSWLPADFLSEVAQGISELIVHFVLLSIAFGWTLLPGVNVFNFFSETGGKGKNSKGHGQADGRGAYARAQQQQAPAPVQMQQMQQQQPQQPQQQQQYFNQAAAPPQPYINHFTGPNGSQLQSRFSGAPATPANPANAYVSSPTNAQPSPMLGAQMGYANQAPVAVAGVNQPQAGGNMQTIYTNEGGFNNSNHGFDFSNDNEKDKSLSPIKSTMMVKLAFYMPCLDGIFAALRTPHSTISVFIFVSMLIVQFTLEVLGRGYEDDFNQFHDHEHWPGYTLMGLRVLYFGIFFLACGVSINYASLHKPRVVPVYNILRVVGSVWFLAFPVLVGLAVALPTYHRHGLITGGALTLQSFAICVFTYLFLNVDSDFYKASSISQMGTIFGGLNAGSKLKLAMD